MKRTFIFTWQENKKYNSLERKNTIMVPNASEDIGLAAKAATEVFTKTFGNLKKNTIKSIQEINENGEFVGEPITPQDEVSIVPTGR